MVYNVINALIVSAILLHLCDQTQKIFGLNIPLKSKPIKNLQRSLLALFVLSNAIFKKREKQSLKRNMEYLFIYQEYATLNIPRTTNRLESFFKEMKSKLSAHTGLSDSNKMMFLKDFIHRHC